MTRQIKLGAFLPGGGQHIAAWRHPDAPADGATNFEFHKQLAQTAERGLFDAYFLADNLSVGLGGREGGNAKIAGFEPVTLFAALAPLTTHLGFIATASTTYEEPYTLARKFASLDLLSNGRAGWNVVTSAGDDTARNFNRDKQPDHADRYARAHEHVETVKALWDSWEDDAFIRDKESGPLLRHRTSCTTSTTRARISASRVRSTCRARCRAIRWWCRPASPRTGAGSPPLSAEVIFTAHQNLASAQEFYRDIKARVRAAGRNPDHVLIMPGVAPFVGRTEEEARAKYQQLNDLILPEDGVALLNGLAGGTLDIRGYPLDGPLPPSEETEGMKSRQALIRQIADEHGFTIRQLYQWMATARGHYTVVGSAEQVADQLEEWFRNEAADGFNILPPWLPGALDDFVDLVIPELQRRGLFRTAYEGRTLRENLGLPRPVNPWTAARASLQAAE